MDIYVELDETEAVRFATEVEREPNKEIRNMEFTWEEALAASKTEGRIEGKVEGKAEGRIEGKAEATRSHILRILRRRLLSVPSSIESKLRAIDSIERLEEILDQALVVPSADDLSLVP